MTRPTTPRGSRKAGVVPFVAGIASALALTGAAVYTVGQAACTDPARYIRHDNHIELVGGCIDGSELPRTGTGETQHGPAGTESPSNYRP
ncbi:hypothetical protein ACFS2C_05705 [Prauserella oleivorans]|uniref:Secreted protein n=1 Tax=Prauserella oleivorans TaxID=1478153 RepID=A0ABW5W6T5_9PSEU